MQYLRSINYYETDKMGIVHHSNYIRYFEEARIYLMDSHGISYASIEETGILIPVLSINAEYRFPVTFGDELLIEADISAFSAVKMTIGYKAYRKADMQLATVAESSHCFLDASNFKPVNVKKKSPHLYEKLLTLANILK